MRQSDHHYGNTYGASFAIQSIMRDDAVVPICVRARFHLTTSSVGVVQHLAS